MQNDYEALAKMLLNSPQGSKAAKNIENLTAIFNTPDGKAFIAGIAKQNPGMIQKIVSALMANDKKTAKNILSSVVSSEQSSHFVSQIINAIGE